MSRHVHSVKSLWQEFEAKAVPPDYSELQREECRKIFYSGFFTSMAWTAEVANGSDDTRTATRILDRAWEECRDFFTTTNAETATEENN